MKRIILITIVIVFLSTIASAQNISEKLCNSIFDSVARLVPPIKVYHKETYSSDCSYNFDSFEKSSVLLTIEKFETTKEAHKEVIWQIDPYLDHENQMVLTPQKLDKGGVWDEAFDLPNKHYNHTVLRKNVFVIEIFGDHEIRTKLEILLRDFEFRV